MAKQMGSPGNCPQKTIVGFASSFIRALPDTFTMEYFMSLVTALPNHKAVGCSIITNEMIKYACHEIHLLLYEILCTVLTIGIIPKQWHINQIEPVYKQRGGREESFGQHPLICLMEIIKKIHEGAYYLLLDDSCPTQKTNMATSNEHLLLMLLTSSSLDSPRSN